VSRLNSVQFTVATDQLMKLSVLLLLLAVTMVVMMMILQQFYLSDIQKF